MAKVLAVMEPMAVGAIMAPATRAGYPSPTWSMSGMRNGTQPVPRRDRIFPPMPTEKVRVRKTDSLISGEGCRRAWRMYSPSRAMPLMSSTGGRKSGPTLSPKTSRPLEKETRLRPNRKKPIQSKGRRGAVKSGMMW